MENKKYPKLYGKCPTCLGCNRLEDKSFTGTNDCEYADEPIKQIKQILGTGEQMKL